MIKGFAVLLLVLASMTPALADDAAADFSVASNPNGVWPIIRVTGSAGRYLIAAALAAALESHAGTPAKSPLATGRSRSTPQAVLSATTAR
jgi:hypothetical protein